LFEPVFAWDKLLGGFTISMRTRFVSSPGDREGDNPTDQQHQAVLEIELGPGGGAGDWGAHGFSDPRTSTIAREQRENKANLLSQ
jgi:hypothetical protein